MQYEEIEPLVEVSFELDEHNDVLAEMKNALLANKESQLPQNTSSAPRISFVDCLRSVRCAAKEKGYQDEFCS